MSSKHIININLLAGIRDQKLPIAGEELAILPFIQEAFLTIEDGIIAGFGRMEDADETIHNAGKHDIVDAKGSTVLPCWCDSHTHLVFTGSREEEFVDKIRGRTYAEINAAGGGILNSSKKLNDATEDQLFAEAWQRIEELERMGTGAIEIKSGYGLTIESELKMLRVIRKLKEKSRVMVKSTFLGAHTYPEAYLNDHEGYIKLIIERMIPEIAKNKLADYIDVFCEKGFFGPKETEAICLAGIKYGLRPKLHVNQLHSIGGIETGIKLNALSMDHLEVLSDAEIRLIAETQKSNPPGPMATLLPTAAFFLNSPLQPARRLIEGGCAIALASDFNPGSSPSGNMNFVVSLSCIQMRLLPEEAINAATLNGAFAMGCNNELGSICVGKKASLIFTKPIPSIAYLPYAFGSNLIGRVMIGGEWVN